MTVEDVDGQEDTEGSRAVEVVLVAYPLLLAERAAAQYAEALREMALLVANGTAPVGSFPRRVTTLVGDLTELRELTTRFDSEKAAALARGESVRDLSLAATPRLVEMSRQLDQLLDGVDDYCRREQLLTLAPDPDLVDFRRWYVEQLVAQSGGKPPAPWTGPVR